MNYQGVIIEESLEDKDILKGVRILSTKVELVTKKHETPWLKEMGYDCELRPELSRTN